MKHRKSTKMAKKNLKTLAWLATGGLALMFGLQASAKQTRRMNFHRKSVVITGGSRGLGLELARKFAAE